MSDSSDGDTEQRDAPALVVASEARLRAAVDTATEGIVMADALGDIVEVNRAAGQMFGYATSELVGRPLTILMPERFHVAHRAGLQRFLTTGEARVIGRTVELTGLRKNGEEFPIELSLAECRTVDGTFFTGILRDITWRRRAASELAEERARLAAFFDATPDAIFIVDEHGCIELVNAQAEQLFGYGRAEMVGERIELLVPERARSSHVGHRRGYVRAAQRRPMGLGLDLYGRRKDGSEFPVEISLSPLETERGTLTISAVRDITDRAHSERALADQRAHLELLNTELETFSYSVSHDLRAPLRSIQGFSQVLLQDCHDQLNDHGRDALRRICAAIQRMEELIDGLLTLARVTRADLHHEVVDLSALARAVTRDLRTQNPARIVECVIQPDVTAYGDARLLRAVLENLLGNAWKATARCPRGQIEFGVSHEPDRAFFVRDNGMGFDPAYRDKLFSPLQTLHRRTEFPGTGIGLATVQRIVTRHGGMVWATGAPRDGAAFYFTL